jgi:hypothetical protein
MTLVDVLSFECELGFERGIAAGAEFESVRTLACDELLFSHGTMNGSQITCDLLRVYAAYVFEGALDGDVQADAAHLEDTTLGLAGATSLDVWASTIERVSFCEHSDALQFGEGSVADCVDCADAPDLQACRIGLEQPRLSHNPCPLLQGVVPECKEPWPSRERPR